MSRLSGVGRSARYRRSGRAAISQSGQGLEEAGPASQSAGSDQACLASIISSNSSSLSSSSSEEEEEEREEQGNKMSGEEAATFSTFRPDRTGVRKVLGDLEADVMEYIWSQPAAACGLNVREVFEAFNQPAQPIAYTTVMNTMSRLARKQLLSVRKEGLAFLYSPKLSQQQFIERFIGRILDDLLVSFGPATRAQLEHRLKEEEHVRIAGLKKAMDQLRAAEQND